MEDGICTGRWKWQRIQRNRKRKCIRRRRGVHEIVSYDLLSNIYITCSKKSNKNKNGGPAAMPWGGGGVVVRWNMLPVQVCLFLVITELPIPLKLTTMEIFFYFWYNKSAFFGTWQHISAYLPSFLFISYLASPVWDWLSSIILFGWAWGYNVSRNKCN